jgi:hypothetical protein
MPRTLGEIAARYEEQRERALANVRSGEVSASMSGVEHRLKPWAELDVTNPHDLQTICTELSWNGQEHDLEAARPYAASEKELLREFATLSYLPWEQRGERQVAIMRELAALSAEARFGNWIQPE